MEHRWGQRLPVKTAVGFTLGPHAPSWMRDVSASGAFIETVELFPMFSLLDIEFMVGGSVRSVPAYVVRVCADGMGIEWCTFAPPAVRALLTPANGVRPRAFGNA